jgi:hypothetical protein
MDWLDYLRCSRRLRGAMRKHHQNGMSSTAHPVRHLGILEDKVPGADFPEGVVGESIWTFNQTQ